MGALRDVVSRVLGAAVPAALPAPVLRNRYANLFQDAIKIAIRQQKEAGWSEDSTGIAVMQATAATLSFIDDEMSKFRSAPRLEYCGVYSAGRTYEKGSFVTFAGSLWHANEPTSSEPGEGPAWTLACKRGRDGKDLR